MTEPLPCPCGSPSRLIEWESGLVQVECTEVCGWSGPVCGTPTEAVEAWDRVAGAVAERDALRAEVEMWRAAVGEPPQARASDVMDEVRRLRKVGVCKGCGGEGLAMCRGCS